MTPPPAPASSTSPSSVGVLPGPEAPLSFHAHSEVQHLIKSQFKALYSELLCVPGLSRNLGPDQPSAQSEAEGALTLTSVEGFSCKAFAIESSCPRPTSWKAARFRGLAAMDHSPRFALRPT